jgi:hypothetical protein
MTGERNLSLPAGGSAPKELDTFYYNKRVKQWAPSYKAIFEQSMNEEENLTHKASSISCSQKSSQKLVQRGLTGPLKKRPTMPPTEIRTQRDLPGSDFMGPMKIPFPLHVLVGELKTDRNIEVEELS